MMSTVARGLSALLAALMVSFCLSLVVMAQQPSAKATIKKLPKPGLPRDLVYLRDIDPTIREDIRYATANNFTGAPLPGYYRGACILRRAAALALKRVQADLMARTPPLSLKVFDCYRPVRAVQAMVRWSKRKANRDLKQFYFPNIPKRSLFSSGYISARSTHSTGSTVDLSIVNVSREAILEASGSDEAKRSCVNGGRDKNDPSAMDMGTAYDCFDVKSHTWSRGLNATQVFNRKTLVNAMSRQGFSNYRREWWHFTHRPSRSKRMFNVPVH